MAGKSVRPARATGKTTCLKVQSGKGDYFGLGKSCDYVAKDMTVAPSDSWVNVRRGRWALDIAPGRGKVLKVGDIDGAKRQPFNEDVPGLNFSGNGRRSNKLSGKLVVREFLAKDGKVTSLAIDSVQHSEENNARPLVGMLRFNSSFK